MNLVFVWYVHGAENGTNDDINFVLLVLAENLATTL